MSQNWHRADIVAAVHKKGSSLYRLSLDAGFAGSTLRASLTRRHPKAHAAIAAFLGVATAEIWPEWYAGDVRPKPKVEPATVRRPASSRKAEAA